MKKIKHVFNRAATHGATILAGVVLTIGAAVGVGLTDKPADNTRPPVAEQVQAHESTVTRIRQMGHDITTEEARLAFTQNSITHAQKNLGLAANAKLGDQMDDLNKANAQLSKDNAAQTHSLAAFRKEILLNPSLSETEATHLYQELFFAAQRAGLNNVVNYFSPFTDALVYRDETIAKMGVAHDPAKISDDKAAEIVTQARAADKQGDNTAIYHGVETFGGLGLSFLGLVLLGSKMRKKEEEQEAAARPAPRIENTPLPPKEPQPEPAMQVQAARANAPFKV